ncbi:hypothetical protein JTE90_010861 [Oedothorax gibbosus]|uniref:Ubinuclein middle domain-containing protein n=1 Tax=Oedothorax gibbosus TaxID=931172 RepID=A0AAV6V4N7_9ARAC|nr:hypothetical protein JTE90_010861 [Oedothorax gibbosus]
MLKVETAAGMWSRHDDQVKHQELTQPTPLQIPDNTKLAAVPSQGAPLPVGPGSPVPRPPAMSPGLQPPTLSPPNTPARPAGQSSTPPVSSRARPPVLTPQGPVPAQPQTVSVPPLRRKYLCDVVRIKLKCYEVSKTRIQSAEEYLRHFLEAEVKCLWPAGWMQSRILFRESRAAHFYLTNRPKKQILAPKKTLNPLAGMINIKSGMSLLNNTIIPQDTEFDQIFQDKSVPLIPPVENVLDKSENMDLLGSSHGISAEDRAAEFNKLFTLPINPPVEEATPIKNADVFNAQSSNKVSMDIPMVKNSSPLINLISDTVMPSKSVISKSDKLSKSNKNLPYTTKMSDMNTFAEGSLASDMLARIICASLADFPYAGSHNSEKTSKTTSVISPNPAVIKESRVNTKYSNDLLVSPKKTEGKLNNADVRKSCQESGLNSFSSLGINIESFLNAKTQRTNDMIKNKGLPTETSAVQLQLKDSIVPHPRQFAEAFERSSPPTSKKHSMKGNLSVSGSSRLNEHISEYPSSTSPHSLENAQKLAFDLAKYNTAISSQGSSVAAPFKKRSKFSQSNKVNEQWNQHFLEASLGTSLLEGMKGFPFPVSSMPTPPPAHSSSPRRTPVHNSPRSHISLGLRNLHESKSDATNQNSQAHSNIIPTVDIQRRQSLIQGPWKSSPSQSPSTSHNHYKASASPPISNQCKTTSSNHHSPNSVNMSPVPAHSLSQVEKVYNRSHSPLPLRASPSRMSLGHTTKTSSSNVYSPHSGQTQYTTHQSNHTVSSTHHPAIVRTNVFDPSNPVTTSTSSTATFAVDSEMKTVNPRTT